MGDNEQTPALPEEMYADLFARLAEQPDRERDAAIAAGFPPREVERCAYEAGVDAATKVIREWLAGRTVLELPQPDGKWTDGALRWDTTARTITAGLDLADQPFIRIDGELLSVDDVEASALAELAAVREARRLASESSGDGDRGGAEKAAAVEKMFGGEQGLGAPGTRCGYRGVWKGCARPEGHGGGHSTYLLPGDHGYRPKGGGSGD